MTPETTKIDANAKIKTTHYAYYDNGKVMSKTPYVNDKKHGIETWWRHVNGEKNSLIMWKDGKKQKADMVETCYVRGKEYEWTTRNEEMAVNTVKRKITSSRV